MPIILQAWRRGLAPLLLAALGACQGIDLDADFRRDAAMHAAILDQEADAFAHIDPLALNDAMRAYVDRYIDDDDGAEVKVRKLQLLLFGRDYLNLQYSDARTHTAAEAFAARQGNCLSVVNLYLALARYVGVDARYQTVEVRPSWDRRGTLLVVSRHINATGRLGSQRRYVVDFTPEIALQQLTAATVDDTMGRALYFNNLGVEALIAGDLEMALRYFKNALYLEPQLSLSWNNIGAVYNRLGKPRFAEYSYHMAFAVDDRNATAVSNLAQFYAKAGDEARAREYARAVERFANRNPYHHFARGQLAWERQDLEAARQSFRQAIKLKKEEPDFYQALAKVHDALGNEGQAGRLRAEAAALLEAGGRIYQPSQQKLRIVETATILRDASPGISIVPLGSGRASFRARLE